MSIEWSWRWHRPWDVADFSPGQFLPPSPHQHWTELLPEFFPFLFLLSMQDIFYHLPAITGQNNQLDILPSPVDRFIARHSGWKEENNFALFTPNRRFGSKISALWTLDEIFPRKNSKYLSHQIIFKKPAMSE